MQQAVLEELSGIANRSIPDFHKKTNDTEVVFSGALSEYSSFVLVRSYDIILLLVCSKNIKHDT